MQNSDIVRGYVCNEWVLPFRLIRTDKFPFPEGEEDFNNRLRLSSEYFNYYIHTENLEKTTDEILKLLTVVRILTPNIPNSQKDTDPDNIRFKICVLMDVIKGQSSYEEIRYLEPIRKVVTCYNFYDMQYAKTGTDARRFISIVTFQYASMTFWIGS